MRVIKFRVFDKTENDIVYWDKIIKGLVDWDAVFIPNKDIITMQFTGLTDKYGKEIYEGDIVRLPTLYETPEMTNKQYTNWEVLFIHGTWNVKNSKHIPSQDDYNLTYEIFCYDGDIELVGNIYENPELLLDER